jgi:biopolymer transport protein ExbB
MSAAPSLGLAHFITQTDAVGLALFVTLIGMSVLSWTVLLHKAWRFWLQGRHSRAFLSHFWRAPAIGDVHVHLQAQGVRDPFGELSWQALQAQAHHARWSADSLALAGTPQEYLTRTLRKTLDEVAARQESGLTLLATVASTAPFVGLFGTVWGVYHALAAIGMSGSGSLDQVAGPVGEALIMTGVGLAVAIPAVVGYNALSRGNRQLAARLDAFAFELFTFLSTGQALARRA